MVCNRRCFIRVGTMRKQIHLEDIVQSAIDSNDATNYHIMPGVVATFSQGQQQRLQRLT